MHCPKCKSEINDGVKFCNECGSAIGITQQIREEQISNLAGQKALRVIGWIIVPFIMIFVSWKDLRSVQRFYGTIWAVISLFYILGHFTENQRTDNQLTAPVVASVEQKKTTVTDEEKVAAKNLAAKAQKEAEDKAKAEAEAEAEAEAKAKVEAQNKAKEPISKDFVSFDDPYQAMTDIQKDKYWEEVKGKYVEWSGKVVEVRKDSVTVIVKKSTFVSDFRATIILEQRDQLISINKNDVVKINGKLSSKSGIVLDWGLTDARIIK
ncbi:zinc ribbon domain-containing protein [Paenibacillus alba]|uniref:Zinc ribbon domain-containing protein n=1 Tax=Paenibacillus alba TaxID=1197127 RepID=A0ABU6G5R1_9BACL|nr:zinc ribbon domain-containing protein [Paenibacillus alba]MEC0229305.1 zinc ribbon domain-containing protein [Paenibacillus alba]